MGIAAVAAKVGSDFEASMSKVAAVSGATGSDLEALTAKARELGATTQFSASEAADALNYMAMAGWDTEQMLGGIDGVMSLAAASGEDLAMVSDIVTDALTAFGMSAADSGRFADVLATASSNANTNVSMLGESFKYVAPVAGALGYTVEDTSKALSLMANAGIKGSQAGTSLKTMMTNLANPTKKMQTAMDDLGISLTNTDGSMKTLDEVMVELRGSFDGLTEAEQAKYAATIFGKEAMAGALAVINASQEDYDKLSDAINNSSGAAENMAAIVNDNLQGRLKEMKSALEEAAISIYENMQPALEKLVEWIKQLADWFNNLSPAVQNMIVIFAGIAAAIGPVLIILGTLISSIGSIVTAIAPVIAAVTEMGGVLALLTNPITIAIAAITGIIAILVTAYNKVDWFREMVDEAWNKIKEFTIVAFEAISNTISTIVSEVVDFVKGLLDKFKDFWDENGKFIMEIVKNYFESILATIKMVMGLIKGVFETVWPIISNVVKVTWELIKSIVKTSIDIVLGIIQTVMKIMQGDWKGAWETIKKTAENIWKNTEQFFKNIDLVQIGKDIIQGLINGIGSMATAVWDKAKDIASGISDTIKNFFGIRSPSRLMMEYGGFIGEGLEQGLDGTIRNIKQAADEMANAAFPNINPVDTHINKIDSSFAGANSTFNGMNSFARMFEGAVFYVRDDYDIQHIATEIGNTFSNNMRVNGVR
ncbi:phage tail tape measure protein [Bacillus sp. FJAT-49705]|uniref:Phage tail tape measure protein n=2 Tax=Cytobacillus citreus TaxID=2833586 RepID=A0ABS5NTN7_9BACI|nr:phage tail tape measure protein [Cytobacillus citreus]MBS4191188.1 phage tail tape measure protein [Cytobacillus citreus]